MDPSVLLYGWQQGEQAVAAVCVFSITKTSVQADTQPRQRATDGRNRFENLSANIHIVSVKRRPTTPEKKLPRI